MIQRVLLTGALLTAVTTIGCSDYVMQPEEVRFDAEVSMEPNDPRLDVVREDNGGSLRNIADYSDQDMTPPTPPDLDIEKLDVIDSLRGTKATTNPPSPGRLEMVEDAGEIEIREP